MAVMAIAMVAMAVVSAVSAMSAAKSEKDMNEYNAKVAENQAIASRQQAAFEGERIKERSKAVLARQRALYGKAGVEVGAGSPLELAADTAYQADVDMQAVRYSGETQARQAESQAKLDKWQGKVAMRKGYMQAGTSLLKGAASAYGAGGGGFGLGGGMAASSYSQHERPV